MPETTPPIPQPGGPPSPIAPNTPGLAPLNTPPTDIPPANVPETPPQAT